MKRWLVSALLFVAAATGAQERIVDFQSDITIQADGALTVTETIVVQAQGQSIRRGILRDFPTQYRDRAGNKVRVPFTVVDVTRNGAAENYVTESLDNGVRTRIGNKDVLLPRGKHTYTIIYRTARQLGFFDAHDELYWNVTGNGWTFAIDHAKARVTLPRAVPLAQLKAEGYAGPQGARGTAYTAQLFDGGGEFETTRRLAPREGLTIVLSFPKGVVAPPSALSRTRWFLQDNVGTGAALGGLLLVCGFLYRRWDKIGRDPKPGPRFPRYEPPANLLTPVRAKGASVSAQSDASPMSPAAVRFVDRMKADNRCFAAALLGLGARGYLTVFQHGKAFTLKRTGREVAFGTGELQMSQKLFGGRKEATIDKKYDPSVAAAQKALHAALEHEYEGVLFRRNRTPLVLAGAAAMAIAFGAAALEASALVVYGTAGAARRGARAGGLSAAGLQRAGPQAERRNRRSAPVSRCSRGRQPRAPAGAAAHAGRIRQTVAVCARARRGEDLGRPLCRRAGHGRGGGCRCRATTAAPTSTPPRWADIGALSDGLDVMGSTVSAASSPPGSSSGSGGGGSSGGGGGGGGSGW